MTIGHISTAPRAGDLLEEGGTGRDRSVASSRFPGPAERRTMQRPVSIDVLEGVVLEGDLTVPSTGPVRGVVAFPHVSRETRRSFYNRAAVSALSEGGLATLLFESMTLSEKHGRESPADACTVAQRLAAATRYLRSAPETRGLAIGFLASGAGVAGALHAAAELAPEVRTVVAFGAVPSLLDLDLERVTVPVLLIASGTAAELDCGRRVCSRLGGPNELAMIPGSHLLTAGDPRPHRRALALAGRWFVTHLADGPADRE